MVLPSKTTRGEALGGLSGLAVAADGATFLAISDMGFVVRGRLVRDPAGRIAGGTLEGPYPLVNENGEAIRDPKRDADAEALRQLPDGSFLVAFEHRHRLARLTLKKGTRTTAPAPTLTPLPFPTDLGALESNAGIEAITLFPSGAIELFAEKAVTLAGIHHRTWVGTVNGTTWRERAYKATEPLFDPVDGLVLSDCRSVLLERRYIPVKGVSVRVVVLPPDPALCQKDSDAPLAAEQGPGEILAELSDPTYADNFEAIDGWRTKDGEQRLVIVSDDNLNPTQRSLLIELAFPPELAPAPAPGITTQPAPR